MHPVRFHMPKILIVEDNLILADFLEDFLIIENYAVCGIAGSVAQAVVLANIHKPDLAVMDFRLANGSFSTEIRPLLKDRSMGILYVSGDILENRLTSDDGDACIQKPYGMRDLISALQIVQGIRTKKDISAIRFPKGFHLLEDPLSQCRQTG